MRIENTAADILPASFAHAAAETAVAGVSLNVERQGRDNP
ncbi:hypothetical protein HMPREF1318_3037 [Actinomyces massiliensis F0489]|uniref:Uncharacterized protein n=1 Tax=Actinomyces massiliensis F0489 TaxID=1125718 RepID=J0WJJ5_9ACTO|nr:hypothetical protein HMPREF1318_3037 [Actinomyces massiliensis F0489]